MSRHYDPTGISQYSTSCWASHVPYKLECTEGTYEIIGGSCTSTYPEVDVFIGFDGMMKKGKRNYPWESGVDIYFPIVDRQAPTNAEDFKKLVDWVAAELRDGKSVFAGCIGGHGRTGLFLAALTKVMTGKKDAITYVREHYCKKAVESTKQVDWLVKNFGIKKVTGSDSSKSGKILAFDWDTKPQKAKLHSSKNPVESVTKALRTKYYPLDGNSLFAFKLNLDK